MLYRERTVHVVGHVRHDDFQRFCQFVFVTAGQLQYGAFDSSWGAVHERLRAAHSRKQWPTVDILLCHYVEPVTHSMQTLKNCLSLQYAPELTDIFVLD